MVDEECRQAITHMTIARTKCLQQNTRANQEHFKEKKRMKYANKKLWLNYKIMQIGEVNKKIKQSYF
jgi:hypothetical protein